MIPFPPSDAVKAMSKGKGFLAAELFVIISTQTSGFDPIANVLGEHLQYWHDVEARGLLFAAGPLLAEPLEGAFQGGGLLIVRTSSLEEAIRVAEDDPMHRRGARSFQVVPWLLNHFSPAAIAGPKG